MDTERKSFNVIAALDFSELGDRALSTALELASHKSSEVHVISVAFSEGNALRMPGPDTGHLLSEAEGQELLRDHVTNIIQGEVGRGVADVDLVSVYLTTGNPAKRIVALANAVDADMIVVGTHGRRGIERFILGSVASEVVKSANCSVLVVRPMDFVHGEKLPEIEPALKAGEHPLKPFHHGHTRHYTDRAARASSRMMPSW
jgi:nucleotide-binding universal stress UspA family protein